MITDSSLLKLLQHQKLIKRLDIDIPTMTDISIMSIAENCKQLEYLYLRSMPDVTDISMVQIATQCKYLKEIQFNDMLGITDVSMVAISQHCHQLEKLTLIYCHTISDISMQAIAENCRNLTYFGLRDMTDLNHGLIADIASNNFRLKYNCIEVTYEVHRFKYADLQEVLRVVTAGRK